MHVLYCGADFEDVAAGTGDGRLFVVGVDLFFHTLTRFSYSYLMVEAHKEIMVWPLDWISQALRIVILKI